MGEGHSGRLWGCVIPVWLLSHSGMGRYDFCVILVWLYLRLPTRVILVWLYLQVVICSTLCYTTYKVILVWLLSHSGMTLPTSYHVYLAKSYPAHITPRVTIRNTSHYIALRYTTSHHPQHRDLHHQTSHHPQYIVGRCRVTGWRVGCCRKGMTLPNKSPVCLHCIRSAARCAANHNELLRGVTSWTCLHCK